jgi:hypothetical protein
MKNKTQAVLRLLFMLAAVFTAIGFLPAAGMAAETSVVSVDRLNGICTYTLQGIDITQTDSATIQILNADTGEMAFQSVIALNEENCADGTYQGTFTLEDLGNVRAEYSVIFVIGEERIAAGNCDFSNSSAKTKMTVKGKDSAAKRSVKLTGLETDSVSGEYQIVILAWPKGEKEANAKEIGSAALVSGSSIKVSVDVSQAGEAYGTWKTKAVLRGSGQSEDVKLAEANYEVAPAYAGITVKKSKALEEKQSFLVILNSLNNVYEIKNVTFQIYNSNNELAAEVKGEKGKKGKYTAEVTLKKLDYKLDQYTVKAFFTDVNDNEQSLDAEASVDETMQKGTLSVTAKGNGKFSFVLKKAYLPGTIKKVEFVQYSVQDSKEKKLDTYTAKTKNGKNKFSVSVKHTESGSYLVKAYGVTSWGEEVLLNQQAYQVKKDDLGKNGWYYEKYNGKTYKFYYIDGKKQTDLTKLLNIKKSSGTSGSNLYIELNRAACTVTIYLYDEETGKYDIPVKSCPVSVGRDVSSTGSSSSLSTSTSFTPLGDYSICSNGTAVKYTLKPMYEPNGSTVYSRWCTHVVGNIYFHSIAVGSDTHYGLSSYTYNKLGSPASAGCIRMMVADAKWIYDYVKTGTEVKILKGDSSHPGPFGKPKTIKTTSSIHYDPTDPAVPDSRKKADYKAGRISGYMTKSGERVGY